MSFDAARKEAATRTGKSLTTGEVTSLLREMERLVGRRPDEIVGPNLRLRWIDEAGTYTLKLLPAPTEDGVLSWRIGYSNHQGTTLQKRETTVLTREMFDKDVRARMPYLWMVTPSRTAEAPLTVPSWAALVDTLGRTLAEMPSTLAVLPQEWIGQEALVEDHLKHALSARATRDGLSVTLRGTKDKDAPADDAALAFDPVASLEAGPVLAAAFASAYDLGTPLESTDVALTLPGAGGHARTFAVWTGATPETRLDKNVDPNYHSQSDSLVELAQWRGDADHPRPDDVPTPFGPLDAGKHGIVVSEAAEAKERMRARQQRTITIRNAAAAEAAREEPGASATKVAPGRSRKFWRRAS